MADLSQLSTSVLLDDIAKLRRYGSSIAKQDGPFTYLDRVETLRTELKSRGIEVEDFAMKPDPPFVCRLQPLADHCVVLPEHEEDISKGGIIIPETAKAKPMQGEILAVGPGRYEPNVGTVLPMVKVGDVVLFGRYAGVEVVLDEQRVLILREEDLLGVLPPKETA